MTCRHCSDSWPKSERLLTEQMQQQLPHSVTATKPSFRRQQQLLQQQRYHLRHCHLCQRRSLQSSRILSHSVRHSWLSPALNRYGHLPQMASVRKKTKKRFTGKQHAVKCSHNPRSSH